MDQKQKKEKRNMVSRGRGRAKKGVSSVGAEFFKIYLPHLNSEQLLIPPDFIKDFSRTIRDRVILKDISGKKWHVDVGKFPDGVFFKNGWQTFVSYHSLKVGEFLNFRYDGSYSFVVKIFGTNGCKNEINSGAKNTEANVKIEEEEEEEIGAKPIPSKRARQMRRDPSRGFEQVKELKVQSAASTSSSRKIHYV